MLVIIDYGTGNLRSVQKAFEKVGSAAKITSSAEDVKRADKIVLPGVAAFGDAIHALRKKGLADAIVDAVNEGKPYLGFCLGLQLLFEKSFELGKHEGLGILPGQVVRFELDNLKVPHMGWNQITFRKNVNLFQNVPDGAYMYFAHSYHVVPDDEGIVAATTRYGVEFVSSVWRDNIFATQFHPEKSQDHGLEILKNFARQ